MGQHVFWQTLNHQPKAFLIFEQQPQPASIVHAVTKDLRTILRTLPAVGCVSLFSQYSFTARQFFFSESEDTKKICLCVVVIKCSACPLPAASYLLSSGGVEYRCLDRTWHKVWVNKQHQESTDAPLTSWLTATWCQHWKREEGNNLTRELSRSEK